MAIVTELLSFEKTVEKSKSSQETCRLRASLVWSETKRDLWLTDHVSLYRPVSVSRSRIIRAVLGRHPWPQLRPATRTTQTVRAPDLRQSASD